MQGSWLTALRRVAALLPRSPTTSGGRCRPPWLRDRGPTPPGHDSPSPPPCCPTRPDPPVSGGAGVRARPGLAGPGAARGRPATRTACHRPRGGDRPSAPRQRREHRLRRSDHRYRCAPRHPPGSDLAGVHVLRSLDDALGLRAALLTGPRVVVVGAGFLGTEVAAAARTMGLEVTVVEPEPVPVRCPFGNPFPFGDRIGALVADLHRDHGTRLRCGTGWSATRCAGPRPASTPPETSPSGATRTLALTCDWNTA
ncbi:FAD-dependent oxidoreductase [Streptomyces mirabilis]|uniref:FAD-dependent oxidoreductase n=1 Tax=Streptomyces mirabilis TaxID=68239 RepID=UPI00331D7B33